MRLPLTHQHQREMRERREIPRGADRTLGRDQRDDALIQQREQGVHHRDTHARGAARERQRLQHHHQPHDVGGQRRAHPGGMAAQQVQLELREPLGRDSRGCQLPKAGVDPVERHALGEACGECRGGSSDSTLPAWRQRHGFARHHRTKLGQRRRAGREQLGHRCLSAMSSMQT